MIYKNVKYLDIWKTNLNLLKLNYKKKNKKQVLREFNQEKWNLLLKKSHNIKNLTINTLDKKYINIKEKKLYFKNGHFFVKSIDKILDEHIDFYSDIIKPYIASSSSLVELGAGYGSTIFKLAAKNEYKNIAISAGEISLNGRKLIRRVSKNYENFFKVGYCDFFSKKVEKNLVPENAIIFTSYALHYLPKMKNNIIEFFLSFKPNVIINFEPIYEFHSKTFEFNSLCRKYISLNDYNKNFASILNSNIKNKKIKLIKICKNKIGINPLLPISAIVWKKY